MKSPGFSEKTFGILTGTKRILVSGGGWGAGGRSTSYCVLNYYKMQIIVCVFYHIKPIVRVSYEIIVLEGVVVGVKSNIVIFIRQSSPRDSQEIIQTSKRKYYKLIRPVQKSV